VSPWSWCLQHYLALPLRWRVALPAALAVLLVEQVFRRAAPRSHAYARWTAAFEAVGAVWATVILAALYVVVVGPVSLVLRLRRRDLLGDPAEPGAWRAPEPAAMPPREAARHLF